MPIRLAKGVIAATSLLCACGSGAAKTGFCGARCAGRSGGTDCEQGELRSGDAYGGTPRQRLRLRRAGLCHGGMDDVPSRQ